MDLPDQSENADQSVATLVVHRGYITCAVAGLVFVARMSR